MEGKLIYTTTDFDSVASATDSSTSYVNIPRDLSMANRKGFAMTSNKGVPLVYHCRVTVVRPPKDNTDVSNYILVAGAQSNWVTRNASVKLHHAREAMYKNAGVRKSDRARYDKTLRLNYNAASQTWLVPFNDDGNTSGSGYGITGADWDPSVIAIDDDISLVPTLFANVTNEESGVSDDTFNIQNAYLSSRRKVKIADMTASEDVAVSSILRQMFILDDERDDEIHEIAQAVGDAPPYDSDAVAGTYTSKSMLAVAGIGNLSQTTVAFDIDVPFGLFELAMAKTAVSGSLDGSVNQVTFTVDVLGISEMQG